MVDTVKQRRNHYELLGLAQSASSDEIAQAFARELGMLPLRPFGSLAQVSLAYETLRDPIKRVAYDASLRPKPEPGRSLIGRLESSPFIGRAVPQEKARPHVAHRSAASATELLRRPAEPVKRETPPTPVPKPDQAPRPTGVQTPNAELFGFKAMEQPNQNESASINWRLPALAGGALALAVVLGAWTGWESGNDNEQVPPDRLATVKIPAPVPPTIDPSPSPSVTRTAEVKAVPRARHAIVKPRTARERPSLNIELSDGDRAELAQADQGLADQGLADQGLEGQPATDQAVAEAPPVPSTPAKMPLPNATIARTIGRIGYACGRVSSTSAIEGAPGVFKVTCTSGHSYRAAPVRGRYHFRRMGRD